MINLIFLLLLISPIAQASLDSAAVKKAHQASSKQLKQAPTPHILTETPTLSPADLKQALQAKKLLASLGWEKAAKDTIEVFDKYLNHNVTSIILSYCSDPNNKFDVQLPRIKRGPKMHNDIFYPILELRFTEDRKYVEAIFDYCTQAEYQEKKKANPHYQGCGRQKCLISSPKVNEDLQDGAVCTTFFYHTMANKGRFDLRTPNPNFCRDGYDLYYRIQDRAIGVTDDGLLKAQFETTKNQRAPSKELLEEHPGKIFVQRGFVTAQFINISLHVNMAKLLKVILLTPNFWNVQEPLQEPKSSSCVIL